MSTNARIGLQKTADAPVRSIYSHWDGYPAGVGRTLLDHWTTLDKIEKLIALGDLSVLGANLGEDRGTDYFDLRYKLEVGSPEWQEIQNRDECVAYGRDRGEEHTEADRHPRDSWPNCGQEWEYLFVSSLGEWLGRSVGWGPYPTGKWTPLADLVREDEARIEAFAAAQQS